MRVNTILLLGILQAFLIHLYSSANHVYFSHLTPSEGLPYPHVTDIRQDLKGFIWVGTRKGLYKYDGYTINPVQVERASTGLSESYHVRGTFISKKGVIWTRLNDLLYRFITEKNLLVRVDMEPVRIAKFSESEDGRVFLITEKHLYLYNEISDQLDVYPSINQDFFRKEAFHEIAADPSNNIWFINATILCKLNLTSNNVTTFDISKLFTKGRVVRITEMIADSNNNLWIATNGDGLIYYNTQSGLFKQFNSISEDHIMHVRTLLEDDLKQVWVGGELGLRVFNIESQQITASYKRNYNDQLGLNDNAIYTIFQDKDKNMWFGTYFGGINILYRDYKQFMYYAPGTLSNNISGKAVRQIIEVGDDLWIATEDNGLNKYNKKTGHFEHFQFPGQLNSTNALNVHALLKDANENLWIGTFGEGIIIYNLITKQFRYLNTENHPELKSNLIFCITEDHTGTLYFGTSDGLILYDPGKKKMQAIQHSVLSNVFIFNLFTDSHGNVWIATRSNGLYMYNKKKSLIQQFTAGNYKNTVNDHSINVIYEDSHQSIWIGTDNQGLYQYNPKSNEFRQFEVPGGSVSAIVEDNHNMLWVSTEKGLLRMNKNDFTTQIYTKEDGLYSDFFNYNSAIRTSKGQLYFGTINGLVTFNPDQLETTKSKPGLVFSKLFIAGEEINLKSPKSPLKTSLEESSKIVLSHRQANSFSIEYAAILFGHSKSIRYAVKMDGIDNDWNLMNDQRRVNYSKLPPGKYTFNVRAITPNMSWDNAEIRSLNIQVRPPFYQSVWAYCIYLIMATLFTYFLLRMLQIRQHEKNLIQFERMERNKIEELNKSKIDFFTNISHELKTPLTLILSPLQRIVDTKTDFGPLNETLNVMFRNAQRMSRIVDELMTFSKIEIGKEKLKLHKGNVLDFIRHISTMFTLLAKEKGIDYTVVIEDNGDDVWFSIPNVEKIVYNLLSNSFKFTHEGGKISIHSCLKDKEDGLLMLEIVVTDTGGGINKENLHKIFENYYQADPHSNIRGSGIGLAMTKRLVNLHKGSIDVQSEIDKGSTFTVLIDVTGSSYSQNEKSLEIVDKEYFNNYNFITIERDVVEKTNQLLKSMYEKRTTLLLVDDHEEMRNFMSDIFKDKYEILTAENGQQALEITRREFPDLVISDVMMPVMNGFEFCKKLKESFSTCHITVILLTAKSGTDDKIEGYDMGADYYLEKPFNAQLLEKQVDNIIYTRYNNIQLIKNNPQDDVSTIFSNDRDSAFVKKLNNLIVENLDNQTFSVTDITTCLGVSRSVLHVKCKNLLNSSVIDYVREIRMNHARNLLIKGQNISETAYAVGYSDPGYFSKVFKKQFNVTPSDFVKNI